MNPEIIEQFSDIALPEPVGIWPLSWQLWLILGFAIALLGLSLFIFIKKYSRNRYRRIALTHLHEIQTQQNSTEQSFKQANELLKACLFNTRQAKQTHYAKYGEDWYQYLYSTLSNKMQKRLERYTKEFNSWVTASYQETHLDTSALDNFYIFCEQWIRHHQVQRLNDV